MVLGSSDNNIEVGGCRVIKVSMWFSFGWLFLLEKPR